MAPRHPASLPLCRVLIVAALAVPWAGAMPAAKANADLSSIETLRQASEEGILWALLAPWSRSRATPSAAQRLGPKEAAIPVVRHRGVEAIPAAAVPPAAEQPLDGAGQEVGSLAIDDSLDPAGNAAMASMVWDSAGFSMALVDRFLPSSADQTSAGVGELATSRSTPQEALVAASPGPLPVAAALVGWGAARRLRRRQQASLRSDPSHQVVNPTEEA